MPVKLLLSWDINRNSEAEYYEFVVNEFIPRAKRLGIIDIQFWYTTYGECEQIQASGVAPSLEEMETILDSEEWDDLQTRLTDYVDEYERKVIPAVGGFQL